MTTTPSSSESEPCAAGKKAIPWALTFGALGVVYGDIGTSPLYAIKECFHGPHAIPITDANILGVLSLIVWSLILVISIQYCTIVLRADNRGEGGILALMSLANPNVPSGRRNRYLIYAGIFGAALLYGDGMITPAISVLSAVEGLKIVAPHAEPFIVQITIAILFVVFYFQKHGTAKIGAIFGPIILLWFTTLAAMGIPEIIRNPEVLKALSPLFAFDFILANGFGTLWALGAVFLVVTGGEALFADMGHFGRTPIRLGWFFVALPALLCNYFGQGALLLLEPAAAVNPFYLLAPGWGLIPLVCLATMATIIASQAVISGAFSLTKQAVQLGYLPRMEITHTSTEEIGQIYIGTINWALLLSTIWLVIQFGSSSELAAAYGIAVSGTMVITALMMYFVSRRLWKWSVLKATCVTVPFLLITSTFFIANSLKLRDGGWVPLVTGALIFILMTTWRRGREILSARLAENLMPLEVFMKSFRGYPRSAGTAIFMTRNIDLTPPALLHNVRHNKVLHERVVVMTINVEEVPFVPLEERIEIQRLESGFFVIRAHFGYRDHPDIPALIREVEKREKYLRASEAIYFLGRETLLATGRPGMAIWRENLFAFMSRNAQSATRFFKLPSERVVEIGLQVEL